MSVTVQQVQNALPKSRGAPFTLNSALLDISGGRELLAHFPGKVLALSETEHLPGVLGVTGRATLHGTEVLAGVTFVPDGDGREIVGAKVAMIGENDVVSTERGVFDLRGLPLAGIDDPRLVLLIDPGARGLRAALAGDFPAAGHQVWFESHDEAGWGFLAREELRFGEGKGLMMARADERSGRLVTVVDAPHLQTAVLTLPAPREAKQAPDHRLDLVRAESVELSELPLVGPFLPAHTGLEDLFMVYTDADVTGEEVRRYAADIGRVTPPPRKAGPVIPGLPASVLADGLKKGTTASVTFRSGETKAVLVGHESAGEVEAWAPVHVEAGPLTLKRVGLRYGDAVFYLMVDAALMLGSVRIETDRLGIGAARGGAPRFLFGGITLTVDGRKLPFEIVADLESGTKTIAARWQDDKGVDLAALVSALGVTVPQTPLTVVKDLTLAYDLASGSLMIAAQTGGLDLVLARLAGGAEPAAYVAAVQVDTAASLRSIPFLGDRVPAEDDVKIDRVRATMAGRALSPDQTDLLLQLLNDCQPSPEHGAAARTLPGFPGTGLVKGLSFGIDFTFRNKRYSLDGGGLDPNGRPLNERHTLNAEVGPLKIRTIGLAADGDQGKLTIDASIRLGDVEVEADGLGVRLPFSKQGTSGGTLDALVLTIGQKPLRFDLDRTPGRVLRAGWKAGHAGPGVELTEFARRFGVDAPDGMSPDLRAIDLAHDPEAASLAFGAAGPHVRISAAHLAAPRSFTLIAEADVHLALSGTPLVGELIPPGADLVIDRVTVTAGDASLDDGGVTAVNTAIGLLKDRHPTLPAGTTFRRGVSGRVEYAFGGTPRPPVQIQLGAASRRLGPAPRSPDDAPAPAANAPAPAADAHKPPADAHAPAADAHTPPDDAPAPPDGKAEAQSTTQTAGPVRLGGIRIGLKDGAVEVTADVTITVSALTLDAVGLGVAIRPKDPRTPTFVLSGLGLGLAFPAKGITFQGALRHTVAKGSERYEGAALLETPPVGVSLVGAYAEQHDYSSFFLLGTVEAGGPTGGFGPPPFRVKGLCLGGGYNSRIRPPRIEELPDFPLIAWAGADAGEQPAPSPPKDPMAALDRLSGTIVPGRGEDWVAAGLRWTTFEYADFRAVAMVEFGTALTVSLLALGDFTFPKVRAEGERPVARVEIAADLVYSQEQGRIELLARLTRNSYLITADCKPVGGLAAAVWTPPSEHAGDFVFSLGGYHPAFRRPAWYPAVPRVGVDWPVSDQITVRAQAYGAVTPHAFMLGGALDVRYHNGSLRAWLTAHLDALIDWCRGVYDVSFGVSMGVSATVKALFVSGEINVEVGVDVRLAGPPLGGTAHVHLWFISFTVAFGGRPPKRDPVPWKDFAGQLPPPGAAVTVQAVAGRRCTPPGGDAGTWYVDSHGFRFVTHSAVPLSTLTFGGRPVAEAAPLNIRPMGVTGAAATQRVRIVESARTGEREIEHGSWPLPEPETSAVPEALWGAPGEPSAEGDGLVRGRPVGMSVTVPEPVASGGLTVRPDRLDVAELDDGTCCVGPFEAEQGSRAERGGDVRAEIARTLAATAPARQAVRASLANLGSTFDVTDDLPAYALSVEHDLAAEPLHVPSGGRHE